MPFRVEWSDEAKRDFGDLVARDIQKARKLVGSFPHDRWKIGSAYAIEGVGDLDVRALRNEDVTLVYLLDQAAETVEILSVRVDQ